MAIAKLIMLLLATACHDWTKQLAKADHTPWERSWPKLTTITYVMMVVDAGRETVRGEHTIALHLALDVKESGLVVARVDACTLWPDVSRTQNQGWWAQFGEL